MNSQRNVRLISGISVLCFLIFLPRVPAQDGSAKTFIADSTDLDSSRKSAEAAYRAAEEASQQVAREYRTESAQKSPDAKALAEWKQKLTSAVKAAFEAQMKLQQVRLQIAQRDLADVQAKHQRRESLASKIIERRVADLMKSEELKWTEHGDVELADNPDDIDEPRISKTRTILPGLRATISRVATTPSVGDDFKVLVELRNESEAPIQDIEATVRFSTSLLKIMGASPEARLIPQRGNPNTGEVRFRSFKTLGKGEAIQLSLKFKGIDSTPQTEMRLVVESKPFHDAEMLTLPISVDVTASTSARTTTKSMARVESASPVNGADAAEDQDLLLIAVHPSRDSNDARTPNTPVPNFATPQELIDHVETFFSDDNEASVEHYVELLTDDEVKRFSGFLLRTHSTLKAVAGLMATFGSNDPDGDAFDVMSLTTALGLSIEKHRLSNPPPAAESAYQQISEGFNVLQLFSPSPPKPAIDADVYSNLLRMASGVLKDPKSFLRDAMTEMKALAKNSEKKDDAAAKPKKPAEWQVTVDGDTATAVNVAAESDESSPLGMAQTMELIKVGDTWKISSIIPDRVIIEMQQGMTATSSTSNSSDNSDGAKQPSVSRSYTPPVAYVEGANAAVAKSDIRAYSELSDSNVTTSTAYSDKQKPSALNKGSVVGKYLNRHLKKGEMITAEMLVEKPTTEQIVDFWLEEAASGREVFEPIVFPNSTLSNSNLYATNYPFESTYAESFNKKLPEWTDAYLRMLTTQLSATPPESWSTQQERLIRSVGQLVHYQQANRSHDLAEFGELLSKFVILNSNKETAHADAHVRKFSHSVVVLAELARIKGSLPEQVLTTVPDDPGTAAKLKLIKQLAENNAEWRWVHQEHLRLAGILEQAPIQALSLVLTSAPIKSADHLDQWIFAMSDVETYRAHRSSPPQLFAPPIDAVLLIAVADLLAGKQQHTDDNLAMVFDQPGSGSGRTMFNEDASDILEGDLAYRASVLKSLVSIYRKSKSESLKTNIAKLAPAVPVMAAKDVSPEAEPQAK